MKINFKFPKRKKKYTKEKISKKVGFFWSLALYFSGFVVVLAFIFGYFLYSKVNEDSFISASAEAKSVEEYKNRLDQALLFFSERAQKSGEIISSPIDFFDPSI